MSFSLLLKASLGAFLVMAISTLSRTKIYVLAGLLPLFPTFLLVAHYITGTARSHAELKATIRMSMCGLCPLFIYLLAVYFLIDHFRLVWALAYASMAWVATASVTLAWAKMRGMV